MLTFTLSLHAQSFKVEVITGTDAEGQTLVLKPINHGKAPVFAEGIIKKAIVS